MCHTDECLWATILIARGDGRTPGRPARAALHCPLVCMLGHVHRFEACSGTGADAWSVRFSNVVPSTGAARSARPSATLRAVPSPSRSSRSGSSSRGRRTQQHPATRSSLCRTLRLRAARLPVACPAVASRPCSLTACPCAHAVSVRTACVCRCGEGRCTVHTPPRTQWQCSARTLQAARAGALCRVPAPAPQRVCWRHERGQMTAQCSVRCVTCPVHDSLGTPPLPPA